MVTRAPAEQNPAVDPELPQPPAAIPTQPVAEPAPLSPLTPTDVNAPPPVVNVIVNPDLVPLVPTNVNPFPPVVNVIVNPDLVPLVPTNVNPFPPVVNVDLTREPAPVDDLNQSAAETARLARAPVPVDTGEDLNQSAAETARLARAENDAAASQAATEQRLREQQAIQAQFQSPANGDWRVKLKLSPNATYLYKDNAANSILAPLAASDGVVFPYMPDIQTTYNANYDTSDLVHSNYRGYFYKNSYVGDINITGVFTAQNTQEANYLLAVIHFFRSATKMFYGEKDSLRGAPPPLVYLFGLGQYQFNAHPCVIRSFNYSLPNDVDYIRTKPNNYNVNLNNTLPKTESGGNPISAVISRLRNALLPKGALPNVPQELLTVSQSVSNIDNSTYVPTKITVTVSLLPIQTRDQQSQQFSVKGFANGDLLKGGFW